MSETTVCPSCAAAVPPSASFCTNCGHNLTATAPVPPAAPTPPPAVEEGVDPTQVETPGLHDATQVLPPAAPSPAPWAPAGATDQPPPSAWAPPGAGTPPGAAAPAPAVPPMAWQPPATPPPGAPAAVGPAWGPPPAPGAPPATAPTWGAPPSVAEAATWPAAPATPDHSSGASTAGSPLGGIVALIGGALVLVGIFTAWIGSNGGSGTIKAWDMTSGDKVFSSKDPYLLLGLGIVALALGVVLFLGRFKPLAKAAAIVVGVAVIGVCIRDWTSITSVVKDDFPSTVSVKAQFGFYLTIAGGILAAVGGVLPAKKA